MEVNIKMGVSLGRDPAEIWDISKPSAMSPSLSKQLDQAAAYGIPFRLLDAVRLIAALQNHLQEPLRSTSSTIKIFRLFMSSPQNIPLTLPVSRYTSIRRKAGSEAVPGISLISGNRHDQARAQS
jgi:hypothetical protein